MLYNADQVYEIFKNQKARNRHNTYIEDRAESQLIKRVLSNKKRPVTKSSQRRVGFKRIEKNNKKIRKEISKLSKITGTNLKGYYYIHSQRTQIVFQSRVSITPNLILPNIIQPNPISIA